MSGTRLGFRTLSIGLLALGLSASPAGAANQLYQGSWVAESFGNDIVGVGIEESAYFSPDESPS